jgi:MFS family permease
MDDRHLQSWHLALWRRERTGDDDLFRAITGLGVGGEWATGHTYIGETFPPNARGRYAATLETGAAFGAVLAALMGGVIAPYIGWRACFMISAAPAVLSAFVRRA